MTHSSPLRGKSRTLSPNQRPLSGFLADDRNNELSHMDALAAAQAEHDKVREAAIKVFQLHEMREEHKRIMEEERREEERLKAEWAIAEEEKRLQALRAKSIPKPAPPPEPPKPIQPVQAHAQPTSQPTRTDNLTPSQQATKEAQPVPNLSQKPTLPGIGTVSPQVNGLFNKSNNQLPKNEPSGTSLPPIQQQARAQPSTTAPQSISTKQSSAPAPVQPVKPVSRDHYTDIHQNLKKLRRNLEAEAKNAGQPLKGQIGDSRRVIRVSVGQLTAGKGANAQPISKITNVLKDALDGKVPSPLIDVRTFVTADRQPIDGAANNGPQLPALFIYLLNMLSKAVINQFINECSANPKAAEPVGVFTAHMFSNKDFQWRGESLIDIFLAKFRVACPVLFGFRGNDRTERGRIVVGWKKDGSTWITEQTHHNRMSGLGAGFASLSLRDFSKSSKINPYPPTNYWKALAYIINTPPNETSNTQYVVLRSMIQGHEQRFLNFYGNAAMAALRLALVDFPKKAPTDSTAAASLQALGDVLRSEEGLVLA